MRVSFGLNTYSIYQVPPTNANISLVFANILQMPLTLPSKVAAGDTIDARYNNSNHALFAYNVTDFTLMCDGISTKEYLNI